MNSSDQEEPINSIRAAHRSLVLAALVCRGNIDNGAGNPDLESLHSRILEWLTQLDLWDEVEEKEAEILRAPLGLLKRQDIIDSTWLTEGLVILGWALHLLDFPRHDLKVDPYVVTDAVWFLSDDAGELIRTAQLRSQEELEACEGLQYDIHVRLRDFIRHRKKMDLSRWIDQERIDIFSLNVVHLFSDNDLAIYDKPISEAEEDLIQECASIAFQRHRALLWLLGGCPIYSETPVDT